MHPLPEQDEIDSRRQAIRPLLVPSDPLDAMTAYYALAYDPKRVHLELHRASSGHVDGFAAVCQTGQDLFVPLVVMRAPFGVEELLEKALHPGRPYRLVTTLALRDAIQAVMHLEWQRVNLIYVLDPSAYRSVINVMVQPGQGAFRFEIRIQDRVVSAAGVNWQSSRFADMYVYTEPDFEGRGWARAVGAKCVEAVLQAGLLPLYTVSQENPASRHLAQALGFRPSGAHEFEGRGWLRR